jgi:hypothetical protein
VISSHSHESRNSHIALTISPMSGFAVPGALAKRCTPTHPARRACLSATSSYLQHRITFSPTLYAMSELLQIHFDAFLYLRSAPRFTRCLCSSCAMMRIYHHHAASARSPPFFSQSNTGRVFFGFWPADLRVLQILMSWTRGSHPRCYLISRADYDRIG